MKKKEEVLKEERTRQATMNNLMGINGKLGVVVRHLGNVVMREGSGMVDVGYLDDPWVTEDEEDEIKTMDEEEISYPIGFVFDGLSRGMHLEIKYLEDRKELNVFYQGYEVYREVGGDLEKYVPRVDWEEKIDYLFGVAKKVERTKRKEMEGVVREVAGRRQAQYLEDLRAKWGLE